MKTAVEKMDEDKVRINEIVIALVVITASVMGCISRIVFVDKALPGTRESVCAMAASAGCAVFLAPLVARYLASKFEFALDIYSYGAVSWVLGIVAINLVILIAGIDLKGWLGKFTDRDK